MAPILNTTVFGRQHRIVELVIYLHPMTELGDRVARLREDKGWAQRDLAEQVTNLGFKIGQSAIGNIESGQTKGIPKCLPWLADALGVSREFLLYGREKSAAANKVDDYSALGAVRPWQKRDKEQPTLLLWKATPGSGGNAGAFMLSMQKGRLVERPPFLDGEEKAFIFELVGRENEPVYWAGDSLYVNPDKDVEENRDFVFLQSPDKAEGSPAIVGHLVRMTDRLWIIKQWAIKGERELARKDWPIAWRIVSRRHRQ